MIVSDLNYLEVADNESIVIGGFRTPIRFSSDVTFRSSVDSDVDLTRGSQSASAESDALAAPVFLLGSGFTQISTLTATGRAAERYIPGVITGSFSSGTSVSATLG